MDQARMSDTIEIEQLLAKYATGMTRDDVESVMEVFTADGWYAAFGEKYLLADFPTLVAAAPKGLFMTGTPALEFDGDEASGVQTLCFVGQTDHGHKCDEEQDEAAERLPIRGPGTSNRSLTGTVVLHEGLAVPDRLDHDE